MSHRIVIDRSLRQQVLNNLHAAHQGTTGMTARANQTVYWPEMNASIRNHRSMCQSCYQIAPSQSPEPLILTPPPQWPFQQICADYFENEGHSYLTIVDRFSYWINIYHFPSTATASNQSTYPIAPVVHIIMEYLKKYPLTAGPNSHLQPSDPF